MRLNITEKKYSIHTNINFLGNNQKIPNLTIKYKCFYKL